MPGNDALSGKNSSDNDALPKLEQKRKQTTGQRCVAQCSAQARVVKAKAATVLGQRCVAQAETEAELACGQRCVVHSLI